MKKIFSLGILLTFVVSLIPATTFAVFSVGWSATSTATSWISPNKVNGLLQSVVANNFIATSTTDTSTFLGNLQVDGSIQNTSLGGSGTVCLHADNNGVIGTSFYNCDTFWNPTTNGIKYTSGNVYLSSKNTDTPPVTRILGTLTEGFTTATKGTSLEIQSDNGFSSLFGGGASGGDLFLISGAGSSYLTSGGRGGSISIIASSSTSGNGNMKYDGSPVNIIGGIGAGASNLGGNVVINGGLGSTTGDVILSSTGGNVGIGTTGPTTLLYVNGTTTMANHLQIGPTYSNQGNSTYGIDSNGSIFTNGTFSIPGLTELSLTGLYNPTTFALKGFNGTTRVNLLQYINNSTTGVGVSFPNGNVGIGTTSPYAKLSVDGNGVFNRDVRADYFTATSTTVASTLTYASTTALTVSGNSYLGTVSSGLWNGSTIGVGYGGTGQTSFGQGWLGINDSGAFISSTSPTVNYITATSTTATSTFAGKLSVAGQATFTNASTTNFRWGNATDYVDYFVGDYAGPGTPVPQIVPHWGSTAGAAIALQRGGLFLQADDANSIDPQVQLLNSGATLASTMYMDRTSGDLIIYSATGNVCVGCLYGSTPMSPLSTSALSVGNSYSITNPAPTNGMIVEGNVGIGTTSPQGKFEVATTTSTRAFGVSTTGQVQIGNSVPYYGTGANTAIVCYMSNGSLGHITITSLLASGSCIGN